MLTVSFDSVVQELSFGLSGETGTTGVCNVTVPLALVDDVEAIEIFLDGEAVTFEHIIAGDMIQLYFEYTQSSHLIVIDFAGQPLLPTPPAIPGFPLEGLIIGISLAFGIILIIRKRRRK